MAAGKKIKIKEDSRNYVTKITKDDQGNIASMKTRRTLKGLLTGAPRVKKQKHSLPIKKAVL